MAPTVHCIRHAQGYHNLNVANHSMHDPQLTPYGEEQCRHLQRNFPFHDRVDLIVASPIKRTIYTALLGFEDTIRKKNLTVVALPELQETSDLPCDTGSDPEELAREFAGKPVDLELVKPGWDSKRGRWAPNANAIQARAQAARVWLKNRPEKEIAVVTHGGFLHYFTEDWDEFNKFAGTGWQNTEFRSYYFTDHEPEAAHLKELLESQQRRKSKPLDTEEHTNLKRTTTNHASSGSTAQVDGAGTIEQTEKDRPHQIQAKV